MARLRELTRINTLYIRYNTNNAVEFKTKRLRKRRSNMTMNVFTLSLRYLQSVVCHC